jgi:hypothetical protein
MGVNELRISKLAKAGMLIALSFYCIGCAALAAGRIDSKDAATADGSVRAGLHNGKVYAVLTGLQPNVVLSPDSWTGDDESKNWNTWLVDFDNAVYTKWIDSQPGDGQQTVSVRIVDGVIQTDAGRYYSAGGDPSKFTAAINATLQAALKAAPAMPRTVNPLKEIRYVATFMSDPKLVPRFGRGQLGFMAVVAPTGDNIDVYGRTKEGRAPGIQIVSDQNGGNIVVTEDEAFVQKCRAIDAGR